MDIYQTKQLTKNEYRSILVLWTENAKSCINFWDHSLSGPKKKKRSRHRPRPRKEVIKKPPTRPSGHSARGVEKLTTPLAIFYLKNNPSENTR